MIYNVWPICAKAPHRPIRFAKRECTDSARLLPACASPPSVALRATQAYECGREMHILARTAGSSGAMPSCRHRHALPRRATGHRRACAPLVAPFAAGVRDLAPQRILPFHIGEFIPTSRCDAPERRGAFADERRIVVGDESGGGFTVAVPPRASSL